MTINPTARSPELISGHCARRAAELSYVDAGTGIPGGSEEGTPCSRVSSAPRKSCCAFYCYEHRGLEYRVLNPLRCVTAVLGRMNASEAPAGARQLIDFEEKLWRTPASASMWSLSSETHSSVDGARNTAPASVPGTTPQDAIKGATRFRAPVAAENQLDEERGDVSGGQKALNRFSKELKRVESGWETRGELAGSPVQTVIHVFHRFFGGPLSISRARCPPSWDCRALIIPSVFELLRRAVSAPRGQRFVYGILP